MGVQPIVSWGEFAASRPAMAVIGVALLERHHLADLATLRPDGSPRLHPVSPFIIDGHLLVATPAGSPKAHDQLRDPRYALHFPPGDDDAECMLRGRSRSVTDGRERASIVHRGPRFVKPDDYFFEYSIAEAMTAHWVNVGQPGTYPVREWWRVVEMSGR